MFTERDWLRKQEQINDELRQRAEERARRLRSKRRRVDIKALASNKVLQRTLASAGRVLPAGG